MSSSSSAPAPASAEVARSPLVVLDYEELCAHITTDELRAKIQQAYGYDGLGILAVRGVPGFAATRAKCLPLAYAFGNLPAEVKAKYEHPGSFYSFGWSHGKEKLEGKPDFAKGSYYANPVHDKPVDDEAMIRDHAPFCHPNIWPSEEDCPGFATAFKHLGKMIVDVGALLARHCDAYVSSVDPTYTGPTMLETVIRESRTHKGRLLYYFAMPEESFAVKPTEGAGAAPTEADVSSWCGWHNDHGSLTGLTPAMFFDKDGKEIPCPDPQAGLYIRSRHGATVRVAIPSDYLAFQIGETAQVHTGGILQATPHCVRAAEVPGVSRGTLAVFMEPEFNAPMAAPAGASSDRILRGARGELLPKGVPPLVSRWTDNSQTFGEFTDKTLNSYY